MRVLLIPFLLLWGIAHAATQCAIEIGSKGIKGAVFSYPDNGNLSQAETLFDQKINVGIVGTMKERRFSEPGIRETAEAVSKLAREAQPALRKSNAAETCLVVGSSGVAVADNKDQLASAVRQATGADMSFLTAEEESRYALISTIYPPERRAASILLDIGSGNTKIGYVTMDGRHFALDVPYGTVTLKKAALVQSGTDVEVAVNAAIRQKILPDYREQLQNRPGLTNRSQVYWVGGAAWATATFTHPELAGDEFVPLSKEDIEKFLLALKRDAWRNPDLSKLDSTSRDIASREIQKVMDVFTREDLIAGVGLMKALTRTLNPEASIRFPRKGQWLVGYASEQAKKMTATVAASTPGSLATAAAPYRTTDGRMALRAKAEDDLNDLLDTQASRSAATARALMAVQACVPSGRKKTYESESRSEFVAEYDCRLKGTLLGFEVATVKIRSRGRVDWSGDRWEGKVIDSAEIGDR